ncbi:MAG TPA: hypothetical protein VFD92_09765 [Candidatus Binatia bacterium]|nr:hypothetical protein [Candidatus Binatia bacterium]
MPTLPPPRLPAVFARVALVAVALSASIAAPREARALTLLTAGKEASFLDRAGTARDEARIAVRGDTRLAHLPDPRDCSGASGLVVSSYPVATSLVAENLSVDLPCARWRADGRGFRYRSADGDVAIALASGSLAIRVRGGAYRAVAGPVGYAQAWVTLGDERFLVRFHQFSRNDARAVVARRTSRVAADGESAFWETLWGDADRARDAIALLARASAVDRRDGRSRFLLGMMHLQLFGNAVADPRSADDAAKRDLAAAASALRAATPLLWDGARGDSRVPGFAAVATYVEGVVLGDPHGVARGLDALEAAYLANPLFNSFDLIGAVPQSVGPGDPLYRRVLDVLDETLSGSLAFCAGQPEICGNAGMAPHNAEGAFVLFGDIYAKGGRARDAKTWYDAAVALGAGSGWRPEFLAQARARAADVEARVAAYRDGDASNDPPIIGSGSGACSYCHAR